MKKTWMIMICMIALGVGAVGCGSESDDGAATNKAQMITAENDARTSRDVVKASEEKEVGVTEKALVEEDQAGFEEPVVVQKSTEKAVADPTPKPASQKTVADPTPTPTPVKEEDEQEYHWVLNTNTMKVHYPNCKSVGLIKDHNRSESTLSPEELKKKGYSPCGNCKPFPK